ncbi:actin family [Pilobolus umbonatus]|nr:actin family [Pilobolus umbonatus]
MEVPIVIDNGSDTIKAGFGDDDSVHAMFPTVIGRPRDSNAKGCYVGDEVLCKRHMLSIDHPIHNDTVVNWDDMEMIWNHLFTHELHISPLHNSVLLSDMTEGDKKGQQKMSEIMFEVFECKKTCIANKATLALFATGQTTGVVIESGYTQTRVTPLYQTVPIHQSVQTLHIGGLDATNYMASLLTKRGYDINNPYGHGLANEIKLKFCYSAIDFEGFMKKKDIQYSSKDETGFFLPDNTYLDVQSERIKIPETLFKPSLVQCSEQGIHQLVYNAIESCDKKIRNDLYDNIILSGGNTCYAGLNHRLEKEMKKLTSTSVGVIANSDRRYGVWNGGAVLVNHSSMKDRWITKAEYEENGIR